jgi:5'-3' exonuclease
MGIPAYFSHIIKNYPNILKKFNGTELINNLYLDSNSIIYDCLRNIDFVNINDYEDKLINAVCKKIEDYIQQIKPTTLIYIAFDGVAPVAKMNQQKTRRYKSWFISKYNNDLNKKWDSTAITPGTDFMNKLNLQVKYHFKQNSKYKFKKIIVSGSDEAGEGEHKLFKYIRENEKQNKNSNTVIYGLDADLIMLTINHVEYCKNIYLFRETPAFIQSIDASLDPECLYIVDIPVFSDQLNYYLNNDKEVKESYEKNRIFDYIFLCFLLGNDFLPHFPALNIRTNGIDKILDVYRKTIGNTKKNIIYNKKIVWKNVRKLIKELAENEERYIKNEYLLRNKMEKRPIPVDNDATKFDKEMLFAPQKQREMEKYINPLDDYWQERYYDMLFDIEIDDEWRKEISINYLEGLEWTYKYYTFGCVDWRWSYKYDYPPLLQDLIKYIPYFDTELIKEKEMDPVTDIVQLCYVLPKNSLNLIPLRIKNKLLSKYGDKYKEDNEFEWAWSKYFWECHVKFEEFEVNKIEELGC